MEPSNEFVIAEDVLENSIGNRLVHHIPIGDQTARGGADFENVIVDALAQCIGICGQRPQIVRQILPVRPNHIVAASVGETVGMQPRQSVRRPRAIRFPSGPLQIVFENGLIKQLENLAPVDFVVGGGSQQSRCDDGATESKRMPLLPNLDGNARSRLSFAIHGGDNQIGFAVLLDPFLRGGTPRRVRLAPGVRESERRNRRIRRRSVIVHRDAADFDHLRRVAHPEIQRRSARLVALDDAERNLHLAPVGRNQRARVDRFAIVLARPLEVELHGRAVRVRGLDGPDPILGDQPIIHRQGNGKGVANAAVPLARDSRWSGDTPSFGDPALDCDAFQPPAVAQQPECA
ncbi:MAG: hypothetical protein SFV18_09360 [Bryobacteraceae bacterium]|nr:hypothetical protein [Bryobacteraceae bacterium]